MTRRIFVASVAAAVMLSGAVASAEVIVAYHTNPAAVANTGPSVQGAGISAGNQVFVNSGFDERWRDPMWDNVQIPGISGATVPWRNWRAMGAADPVSTTSYEGFTFSYTGPTQSFDSFRFDFIARGGGTGFNAKYAVFASKNSAPFTSLATGALSPAAGQWVTSSTPIVADISSLGDLNSGDSVEFRLAVSGSTGTDQGIFTQGIQVIAVVPEPSSFALLGTLGAVSAVLRRRLSA